MSVEQVTVLVEAIARLLGVVAWPMVALVLLHRFGEPLRDFFRNLGEFSFKAPGMEASGRRQQVEAAAALGAAVASRAAHDGQPESVLAQAKDVAGTLADLADADALRRCRLATVLWVDDRPESNRYERKALEALGIRVLISTSTDDALAQIAQRPFDAIISDMGRPPDPRAGYTLLDALRARGNRIPFIIYAGTQTPEYVAEARRHGALGSTDRPQELIAMVLTAVGCASGTPGPGDR